MKNLLIIAPSFWPLQGGVESHLKNILPMLSNMGYKITVVCRYDKKLPREQIYKGMRVIRLPKSNFGLRIWALANLRLLLKHKVVHSHDYFPTPIHELLGGKVKWVHTFHGYEGYPVLPEVIKSRQQVRKLVPSCIGVGEFIEKWYGTTCEEWIYGAVDFESLPKKTKPKTDIIFYGRLEEDTGIRTYIKAFEIISKTNDLKMLVVGSGSLKRELLDYSEKMKLHIVFKDFSDDVLQDVAQSKIAFVSGYLSIIEAAAIGLQVISVYDTPIKKDYLEMHPMSAHFKVCSSPEQIYKAYLDAKDTEISSYFRDWAKNQSWSRICSIYSKYYE